jgi:hypothetical protein
VSTAPPPPTNVPTSCPARDRSARFAQASMHERSASSRAPPSFSNKSAPASRSATVSSPRVDASGVGEAPVSAKELELVSKKIPGA